jgi:hypothetical protein
MAGGEDLLFEVRDVDHRCMLPGEVVVFYFAVQ